MGARRQTIHRQPHVPCGEVFSHECLSPCVDADESAWNLVEPDGTRWNQMEPGYLDLT